MMIQTTPVLQAADETITTAEAIVVLLEAPEDGLTLAPLFADLRKQFETLPLSVSDLCYLANTMRDAENLATKGENQTALWQMKQVARRLGKFRNEWIDNVRGGNRRRKRPSGHRLPQQRYKTVTSATQS